VGILISLAIYIPAKGFAHMSVSKKTYTTLVVLPWPVVKHNALSASSCTCGRQPPGIKIYAKVEK